MFWKILKIIKDNLVLAMPITMVLGFAFGYFFDAQPLKVLLTPFTFLMVFPMMINIPFQMIVKGKDWTLQLVTLVLNFIVVPCIAFLFGKMFFPSDNYKVMGLLLCGLLPTSGMTISWTSISNGNTPSAVKMTIIGLVLGSLATPLYLNFFMGTSVEIDMRLIFEPIIYVVFLPLILGVITRWAIIKIWSLPTFNKNVKPKNPLLSLLFVLLIIFVAMSLKAKGIAKELGQFFFLLIPVTVVYIINFVISTLIGKFFFKRGDALALVFGSTLRNLSIALAIAMAAFGTEGASMALIIAVSFVVQAQLAAWYVKLANKFFGPPPAQDPAAPGPSGDSKPTSGEKEMKPEKSLVNEEVKIDDVQIEIQDTKELQDKDVHSTDSPFDSTTNDASTEILQSESLADAVETEQKIQEQEQEEQEQEQEESAVDSSVHETDEETQDKDAIDTTSETEDIPSEIENTSD
eukprot:TRINITY_DN3231_c1_g1_i1.p1 TRINITY_DN3231_c1_g1~~TRINITY_DN3231_c1_g1_i1.p1  ORF type:complete len:462 (-),score=99.62 TRINITY_DN3231_c1_g1_i1:642-2027(-)